MDKKGKLKWGVGKVRESTIVYHPSPALRRVARRKTARSRVHTHSRQVVAHCPNEVIMFPVHHVGMEGINPQRSDGELRTHVPQPGNEAVLRVGPPVEFGDIIEEWERENGKLWNYSVEGSETWTSTAKERELYSKISRRIEGALEELQEEVRCSDSRSDELHNYIAN